MFTVETLNTVYTVDNGRVYHNSGWPVFESGALFTPLTLVRPIVGVPWVFRANGEVVRTSPVVAVG